MALPQIASGEQWLAARRELLAREKELTRAHDLLNVFDGPVGRIGLPQLFEGRRQGRASTARGAVPDFST